MRRLFPVLALLVLVAAACGISRADDTPILTATIDEDPIEITQSDIDDIVIPSIENQEFVDLLFGGTVSDEFEAGVITELLVARAIELELDRTGAEVTEEARQQSEERLVNQVAEFLTDVTDPATASQQLFDGVPYLQFLADLQASQGVLLEDLVDAAADEEHPCVRHILLDTEAEAEVALDRLTEGEDFQALAAELSTGPSASTGGELQCRPTQSWVPEFAAAIEVAEVGELLGPVQTDFGFHIITVYDFGPLPPEEPIDGRALAQQWLEEQLRDAEVEVDETIGTWDPVEFRVIPAPPEAADEQP